MLPGFAAAIFGAGSTLISLSWLVSGYFGTITPLVAGFIIAGTFAYPYESGRGAILSNGQVRAASRRPRPLNSANVLAFAAPKQPLPETGFQWQPQHDIIGMTAS